MFLYSAGSTTWGIVPRASESAEWLECPTAPDTGGTGTWNEEACEVEHCAGCTDVCVCVCM